MILVGVHLGLHFTFMAGMVKKAIRIKSPAARKVIALALLLMVLAFGVYSIAESSFANWLTEPFVTQTKKPSEHTTNSDGAESETSSADHQTTEKSEDGKSGGDMNDHPPKDGENKTGENETPAKHDDATKTVDTSPMIVLATIAKFISIMGVFAAITYYLDKIFMRKKKKSQ